MAIRFEPNIDGFREIRYSDKTESMLEAIGNTVADTCNDSLKDSTPGYKVMSRPGKRAPQGRWRVSVTAVTPHAIQDNAIHNTLLRALGGGL